MPPELRALINLLLNENNPFVHEPDFIIYNNTKLINIMIMISIMRPVSMHNLRLHIHTPFLAHDWCNGAVFKIL